MHNGHISNDVTQEGTGGVLRLGIGRGYVNRHPPPVDAQTDDDPPRPVGKVLVTATWSWGSGEPDPDTSAGRRYQNIVDNFFQKGATSYGTTIEIEDITNSRGEITGLKVTVRCSPDHECTWNGKDVDDDHGKDCDRSSDHFDRTCNFTLTHKEVETPEPEPYEDPSDVDIARQRDPVGTVSASPRSRATDHTVPAQGHCGEALNTPNDQDRDYMVVYTYYVSVWQEDTHGNNLLGKPVTECRLWAPDEPYHPIVWHPMPTEQDPDKGSYGPAMDAQMRGGRVVTVGEALPDTRPSLYLCRTTDRVLKGRNCIKTSYEYDTIDINGNINPREPTDRAPSITLPGDQPEYEPPTQNQKDNCTRRSDHETCINKLERDAASKYNRELEKHTAQVLRYEQELYNLYYEENGDPTGQSFWVCTDYDQWKKDVSEGITGKRCHLVN